MPLSSLDLQGLDPLNTEQATRLCQLASECQALGSDLANRFQTLCGLEATHCTTTQATTHKTVLSGHQAHGATYGLATATQPVDQKELTLHRLCEAANKVFRDTNDTMFSHLLRYNAELAIFISTAKDAIKSKQEEIWQCILLGVTNFSPLTCLSLSLQILQWLPSILWDLSFHTGIPSMFSYMAQSFSPGVARGTVDSTWTVMPRAVNLLTQKLVHLHDRAGSDKASPSGVASSTSSAAPHSTMSSPDLAP